VALITLAKWLEQGMRPALEWAARLFGIGVLIFSGSLYILVFSGQRWLGMVTPLGGVGLIAGWVALGVAAIRAPRRS
jgi:uncharacterized membrane protein YgdD (TMEM256/DUF423 family)